MEVNRDSEHLRWLRIGYFINAGILFLVALFPVIHLTLGIMILIGTMDQGSNPPPKFVGIIFVGVALVFIIGAAALAVCNLLVARNLGQHRQWLFCIVIAAMNIMFSPVGIILSIFSFIVLLRDSVKQLFDRPVQPMSGSMPNWR